MSLIVTNLGVQVNPTTEEIELVKDYVLKNEILSEVFAFSTNSKKWILALIEENYFSKHLIINENFYNKVYNLWHRLKLPQNDFIDNFNIIPVKENNLNLAYRLIGSKINFAPIEVIEYLESIPNFEEQHNFIERVLINIDHWEENGLIHYFEKYISYSENENRHSNFWFYQILRKVFPYNKDFVIEKLRPILVNLFDTEY